MCTYIHLLVYIYPFTCIIFRYLNEAVNTPHNLKKSFKFIYMMYIWNININESIYFISGCKHICCKEKVNKVFTNSLLKINLFPLYW